jgi:hypothetical protein
MAIGLHFDGAARAVTTERNRADVACFVGFVGLADRRAAAMPPALTAWYREQGWLGAPGARSADALWADLRHVPVPVESWAEFGQLFAGQSQPVDDGPRRVASYLGAAVRSFFAQGGRRCYVVRVGDPIALTAPRSARLAGVGELLPVLRGDAAAMSPHERYRWRGLSHLFGLDDVSFVAMPDLPFLVADDLPPAAPPPPEPVVPEQFVECTVEVPAVVLPAAPPPVRAPRCADDLGFRDWAHKVNLAAQFLARHRKDVQLVAAVPLPGTDSLAHGDLLAALERWGLFAELAAPPLGLATAHLQLAYPWLAGPGAEALPERLEPPDGAVVGVLARSTLLQGAFRSAADSAIRNVTRLHPELTRAQRERTTGADRRCLQQRVSLLGYTPDGVQLLSDVTTSPDEAWRPANVNRLMSVWVRALREAGLELVFALNGERLWTAVRDRLRTVGSSLHRAGALRGASPAEAFQVRCDRTTMSSQDIDAGRLIAEVAFQPLAPVEGIRVALTLDESQRVSVEGAAR